MWKRSLIALAVTALIGSQAVAGPYEDDCLLAVSRVLPRAARIDRTAVRPAPPSDVRFLQLEPTMRWVRVGLRLVIGGHEVPKAYLCALNLNGNHVVVPEEGPPGSNMTVR